jgi:hypothetical protein
MSNRKLRTITISAWLRHEPDEGVRARATHKRLSTPRSNAHKRRKREGLVQFKVELPPRKLRAALKAAGHLEGDDDVDEALQIFLEDFIDYGPR